MAPFRDQPVEWKAPKPPASVKPSDVSHCDRCRRPMFLDGSTWMHWDPRIDREHAAVGTDYLRDLASKVDAAVPGDK